MPGQFMASSHLSRRLNQSDGLAATSRRCREWKPFPQESPRRCRTAACRRLEILARVKNPAAKAMSISNAVPMRSMIWPSRFVDTGIQDTVGLLVPPALRLLCRLVGNHWIFERSAVRIVFREPSFCGIGTRKDLEVIRVSNLLARIQIRSARSFRLLAENARPFVRRFLALSFSPPSPSLLLRSAFVNLCRG